MMLIDPHNLRSQQLWYPMRVSYGRAERMIRLKELLDQEHIENFLPMCVDYEKTDNWDVRKRYIPAIDGMIFVHSSRQQLTELKMTRRDFEPMRYWTNLFSESADDRVLVIPDRQMDNFRRVYDMHDDKVALLQYTDFIAKAGKRVRITQGQFANTIGTIKRIKKSQCVIVEIEAFAAMAIAFVPPSWLQELSEEEYQHLMST